MIFITPNPMCCGICNHHLYLLLFLFGHTLCQCPWLSAFLVNRIQLSFDFQDGLGRWKWMLGFRCFWFLTSLENFLKTRPRHSKDKFIKILGFPTGLRSFSAMGLLKISLWLRASPRPWMFRGKFSFGSMVYHGALFA